MNCLTQKKGAGLELHLVPVCTKIKKKKEMHIEVDWNRTERKMECTNKRNKKNPQNFPKRHFLGLKFGTEKFHSHSLTYPQVTPRCARVARCARVQAFGLHPEGGSCPPDPPKEDFYLGYI